MYQRIGISSMLFIAFVVSVWAGDKVSSVDNRAYPPLYKSETRSIPPCSGEVYTIQVSTNNGICYIHQLIPSEGKILIDKKVLEDLADLIYKEIQKKEKTK